MHLHLMHARAAEREQHAALKGSANTACDDGQHCVSINLYKSTSLHCLAQMQANMSQPECKLIYLRLQCLMRLFQSVPPVMTG